MGGDLSVSEEKYVSLFERPAAGEETAVYAPPAEGGTTPYTPVFEPAEETAPYESLFPEDAPAYDESEPDAYEEPAGEVRPGDDDYYEEDGYVFSGRELERETAETDWRDVQDPEEREELLARRDFFRTLSGVSDVVLVFLLTGAVLVLIWLIVALVRYVGTDLPERFTLLRHLGSLPRGGGLYG